jgi:hypothetical protein
MAQAAEQAQGPEFKPQSSPTLSFELGEILTHSSTVCLLGSVFLEKCPECVGLGLQTLANKIQVTQFI